MSQELEASEELGKVLKAFLLTDAGKYIDGCSGQDIDNAKEELFDLDPYEFNTLAELQNKLWSIKRKGLIAQSLRSYIAEAIVNGNQATHQLENEGQD